MASYNTVITNEGAALLASVIANQGTLTFSEMRFSTNDYDGVEATLTVGTFAGTFITAAAAASVVDSTTIKVGSQFDNSGIVGDHPLYSIGIVGTDGNTTAMIAVCTTTNPDIIRAALTGVSTYAFNVNLAVSSTSDITVTGTTAAVLYDTDVVDNLISTATDKPLSANQGRVLKGNVDDNFSGQSNENLLDNPFFTVNQRGAVTSSAFDYFVDRWIADATGFSITNSGMTISDTKSIYQVLGNALEVGTYTVSVRLSDKTVKSATATITDLSITTALMQDGFFTIYYVGNTNTFRVYNVTGSNVTIRAVKLELGSVSTLANDVTPNYTTELLKCQRYFRRTKAKEGNAYFAIGTALTTTSVYVILPLPVPMRTTPTFSYSGALSFLSDGNTYGISSVSLYERTDSEVFLLCTLAQAATAGFGGVVKLVTSGDYYDLVADL